ncbi:MAG: hypothetical protein IKC59_02890 [Clostridia bacterium]|nr:hypothetical protein [Clostridia bacterium]
MNSIQVMMLAVVGVTAISIIKNWNSDFLPLLRMALAVLLAAAVFSWLSPLIVYLKNLTETAGLAEHAVFLFKALGIAWLTQCCADLCRESGENGAASGVELAGKVEILLLSLPLLNEVLEIAKGLLPS